MSLLGERALAVHAALGRAGVPHAFGGAIALAYCILEPRGTRDLDVNVFVGIDRIEGVFAALPRGVTSDEADAKAARRDGQVRLYWDETPVDLFFDTHEFHRLVARGVTEVPFEGSTIPVIGCEALIVFKAMFNRTKDWADIEAMLEGGSDGRGALAHLRGLLGPADPSAMRLAGLIG